LQTLPPWVKDQMKRKRKESNKVCKKTAKASEVQEGRSSGGREKKEKSKKKGDKNKE